VVVERGESGGGPHGGAALAQPPAFGLCAAIGDGGFEGLGGFVGCVVLVGVEDGEVFADDLVGAVALDAFGAGVPADDVPGRVEHEDRVVAHSLHEPPVVGV